MKRRKNLGFTLAEALTILVTIAVLTAIVVPAALRKQSHSHFKSIVRELSEIEAAKQEAAFANGWDDSRVVSLRHDLVPKYLPEPPEDPLGGTYVANAVGKDATYQGKTADEWKSTCGKTPDSPACGL